MSASTGSVGELAVTGDVSGLVTVCVAAVDGFASAGDLFAAGGVGEFISNLQFFGILQ